jgi:hypothetical protein
MDTENARAALKKRFEAEASAHVQTAKYLIVAVQLPTGAIEIITNTEQIPSKAEYYKSAYDEEFRLKTNPSVQVINYMIV